MHIVRNYFNLNVCKNYSKHVKVFIQRLFEAKEINKIYMNTGKTYERICFF